MWNPPRQPLGVKTVWDKDNKRWIWVDAHELWYQDLDSTGVPWLPLLIKRGPLFDYDRADRGRKQLYGEGEPIDGADDAVELVRSQS